MLCRGGWEERRRQRGWSGGVGGEGQRKEGEKTKREEQKEEGSASQGEPHCGVRTLREAEVKGKMTGVYGATTWPLHFILLFFR